MFKVWLRNEVSSSKVSEAVEDQAEIVTHGDELVAEQSTDKYYCAVVQGYY